jgi:uncharacterized protein
MEVEKKKAILIGDNIKAQYHPLNSVEKEIAEIFKDIAELEISDDHNLLCIDNLKSFDLCILYVDRWNETADDEQIQGLMSFLENGGALLVVHNGISLQTNKTFTDLIGARFTEHPPYTKLMMKSRDEENAILDGIGPFEIEEEPYRFDFCGNKNIRIFMEYEHEGNTYPAGWLWNYGTGRAVYLMPGHNVQAFRNDIYRQIILRSGMWALKSL